MAHELHQKMREHYDYDQRTPAAEKEKPKRDHAPWSAMRERYLGGGCNTARS